MIRSTSGFEALVDGKQANPEPSYLPTIALEVSGQVEITVRCRCEAHIFSRSVLISALPEGPGRPLLPHKTKGSCGADVP